MTIQQQVLSAFAIFLLLLFPVAAVAEPVLELGGGAAVQSGSAEISLSLSGLLSEEYGGFSATIHVPACMSIANVRIADRLTGTSFTLHTSTFSGGGGVLLYSAVDSIGVAGELLIMDIQVSDYCEPGLYGIDFMSSNSSPLINDSHAIAASGGTLSAVHTVSSGNMLVSSEDLDNDGMGDGWERIYFGDLSHDGDGDLDGDGYSDVQEYINMLNGITDSDGNLFDPTVVNSVGPSQVRTEPVDKITSNSAQGNGTITLLGAPGADEYGICWNTVGAPALDVVGDTCTLDGIALTIGSFSTELTSLTSGTTYYVRAYITSTTGIVYGEEVSFRTKFPWILYMHLMSTPRSNP